MLLWTLRIYIFWINVFRFSRCIPSCRIARLYGSSSFTFFRKFHSVSHSSCTYLYCQQKYTRVPFSPHLSQHLLFVEILMKLIWTGVRLYLIVVLICISLIMRNVEHLFIGLWANFIFYVEICVFGLLFLFLFLFWYWVE